MQLTYVFSELGTGLRRNISMTVAVVVTIFVSLTLVGMGLLLNAQADKAEEYWGGKLQITVFLCNENSRGPNCVDGEVTESQKDQIESAIESHPEVASWYAESKQDAYEKWRRVYRSNDEDQQAVYDSVRPDDMQESYWIQLDNPQQYEGVRSAVQGLAGVATVRDLREVLDPIYAAINAMKWGAVGVAGFLVIAAIAQVGNTIRLAAFARRREIGIMRLVGASSLYIQLPFILEALFAALVGVGLACLTLAGFLWFVVEERLRPNTRIVEWVDWSDGFYAMGAIGLLGLALTVLPTLVLTRRYLKV